MDPGVGRVGGLKGTGTIARPPLRKVISPTGVLQEGGFLLSRGRSDRGKSEIPLRPDGILGNLSVPRLGSAHSINFSDAASEILPNDGG